MLDTVKTGIHLRTGFTPTSPRIWKSINNRAISRKIRAFMWKSLHDAHRCGKYWTHIPSLEDRAICPTCDELETTDHILTTCKSSSQETVWSLTKELWTMKNLPWPQTSLGSILGCGITDFRSPSGLSLLGANRLFTIIISESMYLIWLLRCEWCIQKQCDPSNQHTTNEIRERWLAIINNHLQMDCTLTNKRRYGKRALPALTVHKTWHGTILDEQSLPDDWHRNTGVLVGIGARRPPGRNR